MAELSKELSDIASAIKDLKPGYSDDNFRQSKRLWIAKLLELSILTMTALSFLLINLKNQLAVNFMFSSVFVLVLTLCCGVLFFFVDKIILLSIGMDTKFPSRGWLYFNVEFIIYLGYTLSVVLAFVSIFFNTPTSLNLPPT